jgi:hypothetical protein
MSVEDSRALKNLRDKIHDQENDILGLVKDIKKVNSEIRLFSRNIAKFERLFQTLYIAQAGQTPHLKVIDDTVKYAIQEALSKGKVADWFHDTKRVGTVVEMVDKDIDKMLSNMKELKKIGKLETEMLKFKESQGGVSLNSVMRNVALVTWLISMITTIAISLIEYNNAMWEEKLRVQLDREVQDIRRELVAKVNSLESNKIRSFRSVNP